MVATAVKSFGTNFPARYNIAPTQPVPVVRWRAD